MIRSVALLALLGAVVALAAEDLPLGVVQSASEGRIEITFDPGHGLLPDDMVAIYGPGTVTRHPLTNEVTVEQRKLVAKAHILTVDGGRLGARVTWSGQGVVIEPGYDAVPLPGEASPDAPPVLTAAIEPIAVEVQDTVTLRLPVVDPEGGPLAVVWRSEGAAGASGLLEARTTIEPAVRWTAPAFPGPVTVVARVSDARGQTLDVRLPITVAERGSDWRKRTLQPFALRGGRDAGQWRSLRRGGDGTWWAIGKDGGVHAITPGWGLARPLPLQEGLRISGAVGVVPRGREVWILDQRERAVLVVAHDGVLRNRIGDFSRPTDLALDDAGAVYVADQGSGGILVHESDGAFRLRLGRPGDGADAFAGLTRIALGPENELYALDAEAFRIHRYDRFHRRLPPWEIQGDRNNKPLDLVHHPALGLLVLMTDGQVLVYDEAGVAGGVMRSLTESGWFDRLREPAGIAVDGSGEVYVTWPDEGLVARYDPSGVLSGVRGSTLWSLTRYAVDGHGVTYGLDARTGLISAFDSEGWMTTRFGGTERYGGPFDKPGPMAVTGDGRYLFVLDLGRITVMRFDLANPADRPFVFGQRGQNPGQFEDPVAIAVDGDGRCYVMDEDLHRVAVFEADGSFRYNFGRYERGKSNDEIIDGRLIAVDEAGLTAFVYDAKRYEMMKFALDPEGGSARHVSNAGGRGTELGQYYSPVAMACDRSGLLYVLDDRRSDLQVVDYSGTNAVTVHAADLKAAGLDRQEGLALGPDGLAWVLGRERLMGLRWKR